MLSSDLLGKDWDWDARMQVFYQSTTADQDDSDLIMSVIITFSIFPV